MSKVVAKLPRRERDHAMDHRDIAPDGMALLTVDAALALLEVDWNARQTPMHKAMASGVKV